MLLIYNGTRAPLVPKTKLKSMRQATLEQVRKTICFFNYI